MLDLDTYKIVLLFHLNEGDEIPPAWIANDRILRCEHSEKSVNFYSISEIPGEDVSTEWLEILDEIAAHLGTQVGKANLIGLSHGLRRSCHEMADLIEHDERVLWHYDYSSRDIGYYKNFWQDIRTAETCCQLVERLEHWVQIFWDNTFLVDPIRRLKHRAFDQIGPIAKDIELFQELCESHHWQEFVNHLKRLREEWQGTFPASQSLKSYLARMWYLILGDHFDWRGLEISPPNDVGLIPVERGERCCLLEILQHTQKGSLESIDEWQDLLQLLQLSETESGTFVLKPGHGVYQFACLMDTLIADSENFNKTALYSGFENNKPLMDELEAFQEWFREVNRKLQSLGGRWQQISSSSVIHDSAAS